MSASSALTQQNSKDAWMPCAIPKSHFFKLVSFLVFYNLFTKTVPFGINSTGTANKLYAVVLFPETAHRMKQISDMGLLDSSAVHQLSTFRANQELKALIYFWCSVKFTSDNEC